MSIKNGHVWKEETVKALIKLKAVDKPYEQRVQFAKFGEAFDKERKIVCETVINPNLEKLTKNDPDTLREINEFLVKDCDLKPLPYEFNEILKKAVISEIDEDLLKPLIAEKVHLAVVE